MRFLRPAFNDRAAAVQIIGQHEQQLTLECRGMASVERAAMHPQSCLSRLTCNQQYSYPVTTVPTQA